MGDADSDPPLRGRSWWILALAALAWTAVFSWLSILKFRAGNFGMDFGNMYQAIASTLDGRWMDMTRPENGINVNRMTGHVELIYALFLPVLECFRSPYTLLILQALGVALGGVAVFLLARLRSGDENAAWLAACAYWVCPYLASLTLSDFHSDPFFILPHLMAWYYLQKRSMPGFWICIGLGMLCKEYAFAFNLLLGILIFRGRRGVAWGLFAAGAFQFLVLTPLINRWAGLAEVGLQLETHALGGAPALLPRGMFARILSPEGLLDSLSLLAIFNLAFLRYPRGLILILPLYLLLSAVNPWGVFANHRHAIMMAPLFILAVEGMARMRPGSRRRYALWGLLVPGAFAAAFWPGSLFARNLAEMTWNRTYRNNFHYRYTSHDSLTDSLLAAIPRDAPLAADIPLRNKLADRRFAYAHPFPRQVDSADFYLFDFFESLEYGVQAERRRRCADLLGSDSFRVMSYVDGLLIVSRKGREPENPARPFSLRALPGSGSTPRESFSILTREARPLAGGYRMRTVFRTGPSPRRGQALISLFESREDTLKVLHLPSFAAAGLDTLAPGTYEEEFFFQIPAGASLAGRKHVIGLFEKDAFLPFFARAGFRVGVF